jgi:transcriptional regulator with XRE-family HTH domain
MEITDVEKFGKLEVKEFAARCRAARGYLGLNLDEVSVKMGLSRQALSRREAGAVGIRPVDRYVMASVYCQLTGWPMEFFTEERLPSMGLTSPAEGGGELEPGDVMEFVSEPTGIDALP